LLHLSSKAGVKPSTGFEIVAELDHARCDVQYETDRPASSRYRPSMPTDDLHAVDGRFARLETVERLLKEYRITKDRRLMGRAIELWDEIETESMLQATGHKQIH
jgi:hypothetical protein